MTASKLKGLQAMAGARFRTTAFTANCFYLNAIGLTIT